MYQFVWLVFPPSVSQEVPDQAHYYSRATWFPCWESCKEGKSLRSGVHDEFRHCLINALKRVKVCKPKSLKPHPKRTFMKRVVPLLTDEAIEKLRKGFARYPIWGD